MSEAWSVQFKTLELHANMSVLAASSLTPTLGSASTQRLPIKGIGKIQHKVRKDDGTVLVTSCDAAFFTACDTVQFVKTTYSCGTDAGCTMGIYCMLHCACTILVCCILTHSFC